ncbi:MAG: helix-turn-helix transcriptional regulator [Acidimicrobiales bacterium]|nr:helix-turn-helix transcriptional regulator [Acidimicrobiales bacterium]
MAAAAVRGDGRHPVRGLGRHGRRVRDVRARRRAGPGRGPRLSGVPSAARPRTDPDARRAELADAAVRAIRTVGADASMADIAAEAGITKPVLYHHFGDKARPRLRHRRPLPRRARHLARGDLRRHGRPPGRGGAGHRRVRHLRRARAGAAPLPRRGLAGHGPGARRAARPARPRRPGGRVHGDRLRGAGLRRGAGGALDRRDGRGVRGRGLVARGPHPHPRRAGGHPGRPGLQRPGRRPSDLSRPRCPWGSAELYRSWRQPAGTTGVTFSPRFQASRRGKVSTSPRRTAQSSGVVG